MCDTRAELEQDGAPIDASRARYIAALVQEMADGQWRVQSRPSDPLA